MSRARSLPLDLPDETKQGGRPRSPSFVAKLLAPFKSPDMSPRARGEVPLVTRATEPGAIHGRDDDDDDDNHLRSPSPSFLANVLAPFKGEKRSARMGQIPSAKLVTGEMIEEEEISAASGVGDEAQKGSRRARPEQSPSIVAKLLAPFKGERK